MNFEKLQRDVGQPNFLTIKGGLIHLFKTKGSGREIGGIFEFIKLSDSLSSLFPLLYFFWLSPISVNSHHSSLEVVWKLMVVYSSSKFATLKKVTSFFNFQCSFFYVVDVTSLPHLYFVIFFAPFSINRVAWLIFFHVAA